MPEMTPPERAALLTHLAQLHRLYAAGDQPPGGDDLTEALQAAFVNQAFLFQAQLDQLANTGAGLEEADPAPED